SNPPMTLPNFSYEKHLLGQSRIHLNSVGEYIKNVTRGICQALM
ncbi:11434_t:CDS:1, partial [Dentiscutata erythropus]